MKIDRAAVRKAARRAAPTSWGRAHVSVAVVDNQTIRELSRRYLSKDRVTDVLAFPIDESLGGGCEERSWTIGEVIVSAEKALQEAASRGLDPQEELTLYLVHGMLHLAGYNDDSAEHRARMYAKEKEIMCGLGHSYVR